MDYFSLTIFLELIDVNVKMYIDLRRTTTAVCTCVGKRDLSIEWCIINFVLRQWQYPMDLLLFALQHFFFLVYVAAQISRKHSRTGIGHTSWCIKGCSKLWYKYVLTFDQQPLSLVSSATAVTKYLLVAQLPWKSQKYFKNEPKFRFLCLANFCNWIFKTWKFKHYI